MTVHFIGAGPGAADLITVRGRDLLARCPVCLYAGSIVPRRAAAVLPRRRAQGRHRADVARRDRARICRRAPRRPGCGAAAFRRPVGVERRRRADQAAGAAGHPLHADARRALLRSGRRRTRPRADHPRGRAEPGADARLRPRLGNAGRRDAGRLRQDRRDAGDPPRHPRAAADRRRADAALWRRLSGRHRGAGVVARRAHRARHAGDHRGARSPPSRSSAPRSSSSGAR